VTEIQSYRVVSDHDGYQLREYSACTVIDVEISGRSFSRAGSAGFQPLLRYISGGNRIGQRMAMTAPVLQQDTPTSHIVSFVLPANTTNAPVPLDRAVAVRQVPEQLVAVRRYSGSTGESAFERELRELRAALRRDGLHEAGPARLARYDPPFMRRNEAQVPVARLSE
jgi:hypothetical protein